MKKILKHLKVIFCIVIISVTAAGTYSYFIFGELYYGKFIGSDGNLIKDSDGNIRGGTNGNALIDQYIYYKNENIDSEAVILQANPIKITIKNIIGNTEPRKNFEPIKILYEVNNDGWDKEIINFNVVDGVYIFNLDNFEGGSFQFKLVAKKNDGTTVMTGAFRLKNNEATLEYYGTNDYLGCENFKLTNAYIVNK